MSEQKIHSHDITVADLFQGFYTVPDYQREYVWQAEQVDQLLTDIHAEMGDVSTPNSPEYFIGSIVVCPGIDNVLELIDGQQRMTTIYLTLCAIRDELLHLGEKDTGALALQLAAPSTDAEGNHHFRYRLDLQYDDSGDILEKIASGGCNLPTSDGTRSIQNICNAYKLARTFLQREFGRNNKTLRGFYGYLTNKVKLIRIRTPDVAKALKIFETINDRGVGLDSMDLLKNLLFMKASRDEFDKLKTHWKLLQDAIFEMNEKPLRFLRYFILSRYDVDVLRQDEIYGWFAKHERLCGYSTNPLGFAEELLQAAKVYGNFLSGLDQNGERNRYLEDLRLLGGRAARQQLILLLAGRHLRKDLFDQLAHEVENLFFVYVITREPTRNFERSFARWAVELRDVRNEAGLGEFISRRFLHAKSELSVRFDDAFRHLYSDSVQKYRLRYILGKLSQYIDIQAYGESESTLWLGKYVTNSFEIEHIFPSTPSEEAVAEFGDIENEYVAERLGNLLLLEKSINASLYNRPYSIKRSRYKKSQLLLTRAISERPNIGISTKIDKAVSDLQVYDGWNEVTVNARQNELTRLAKKVWRVPQALGT